MFWSSEQSYSISAFSMGAMVQQTVYGKHNETAASKAVNAVNALDNQISWRKAESEITKINAAAGTDFMEVSPSVYRILEEAKLVSEKSGGAFTVTIAPLSKLWNFDENPSMVPDEELIQEMLTFVDDKHLLLSEGTVALKWKGDALDLGAVGKGAACDVMAQAYREEGISAAVAAVGGSVVTYGRKPDESPWLIAVRHPDEDGAIGELSVQGENYISTSGDYEKMFKQDGKRYHHMLNPKTGYPAESGLKSVTVITDGGALSDSLSTACFVLGLEKGLALLSEFGGRVRGAVFITTANEVIVTEGLTYNHADESFSVKRMEGQ